MQCLGSKFFWNDGRDMSFGFLRSFYGNSLKYFMNFIQETLVFKTLCNIDGKIQISLNMCMKFCENHDE